MSRPAAEPRPTDPAEEHPTLAIWVTHISVAIVVLLAAAALLGWIIDSTTLRALGARFWPMVPLSAIALIFCGVALELIDLGTRREGERVSWMRLVGQVLALVVTVVALMQVAEYIFDIELLTNTMFFPNAVRVIPNSHPGRSSAPTAVAFAFAGSALFLLGQGSSRTGRLAQWAILPCGVIGLAGSLGYLYGSQEFTELTGETPLALNVSFALLALTAGVLAASPRIGLMSVMTARDLGGRMARRLVPVAIFVPIILELLMERGISLRLYSFTYGIALVVTAMVIVFTAVVWQSAYKLSRVDRVRTAFEAERARLLEDEQKYRMQAEERARRETALRRELEEVTESRARLVRGFSHDLKNPLGAADGHAALLESGIFGPLEPKQQESLQRIRGALHTTLELIDDLVELARSEAGQLNIKIAEMDPRHVAMIVAEEHSAQAESNGLQFQLELPDALPTVLSDDDRVRQILGNLLSNAIKYTPPGGRVTLSAAIRERGPDQRPGRWLCFSVRDTGPGIPVELQDKLFQEFVRLTTRGEPGAGVGLAISQRITHLLGGELTVESEVGKGSNFTLWLPLERSPGEREQSEQSEQRGDGGEPLEGAEKLVDKLAIERARLQTVVDNIPVGLALAEAPSGRIVLTNPALEQILRRPPLVLRTVADYGDRPGYHADGRRYEAEEWPLARALLRGEQVRGEECHYRRGDGTMTWLRIDAAPIRGPTGAIVGAIESNSDITIERRVVEEQRFLSEASRILGSSLDVDTMLDGLTRLAVAGENDFCVIYLRDEPSGIPRLRSAACRDPKHEPLLDRLRELPPGRTNQELSDALKAGQPKLIPKVTDEWLRSTVVSEEQLELYRKFEAESAIFAPLMARGRIFGSITFVRTEPGRRYTEEDLELVLEVSHRTALGIDNARLYEAALVASQAKSDFLAVMSHELRTPLNAILGHADLLLLGIPVPLPEECREGVERITASAQELREQIDEILTFSRLEAGREAAQLREIELGPLIGEVASSVEPTIRERGLEFTCELPDEPITIRTDPEMVRQILHHLLANAVKFTDEGEIGLEAGWEGGDVVVRIRDTGIGIAPRFHERIFEPFWQVDRGTTREVTGTGLGLGVSRRLARMLDGDITVESEPGVGSTFTVRLPGN